MTFDLRISFMRRSQSCKEPRKTTFSAEEPASAKHLKQNVRGVFTEQEGSKNGPTLGARGVLQDRGGLGGRPHSLKPWEQWKKSDSILSTAEGNVF